MLMMDRWTAEALNWLIAIFLKYMSPVAYVLTGNAPGTSTSTELMVYRCSLTLQLMSYGGVRFVMGVAPVIHGFSMKSTIQLFG